jgi:ankyrin repeat protein
MNMRRNPRISALIFLLVFIPLIGGAQVESRDPALIWAARSNLLDIARLLIQKGIDVNQRDMLGNSALHAGVGSPDMIKLLLDSGADINARNFLGATPLHISVRYPKSVAMLLERGADKSIRDQAGRTALDNCMDLGTGKSNLSVAQLLIGK